MNVPGLLGRKIGMTQVFDDFGNLLGVTVIEAGPCPVVAVKTLDSDGYNAVQLGFGRKKSKRVSKPEAGHFERSKVSPTRHLREIRTGTAPEVKPGEEITADLFSPGDVVKVTGWSKGRGFQGVVKRHGFSGGDDTHGSMSHRVPGSIGQSAWPSRVWKGQKLPGRMGGRRVAIRNLRVIRTDAEKNLLLVEGAVPGARGGLLVITRAK
jgi:large subunit ribosomal protein L3